MAYDFNTIARTYDRLNHVMTLGLDRRWRRLGVQAAGLWHGRAARAPKVLDVACGTGDMVLELQKHGCEVTGVDLSEEMLVIAKRKVENGKWKVADAECLPFEDETFDAVTCDFGVRNFVNLEKGLNEMLRVLKPGGRMVILELATPDNILVKPFYSLYTKYIIPLLGKIIAGNREAYTYLPQSIEHFPKGEDFLKIILNSQFSVLNCRQRKLTFGVCRIYTAEKQRGRCT